MKVLNAMTKTKDYFLGLVNKVSFSSAKHILFSLFYVICFFVIACCFLAIPVGYGLNIYKLTQCDFEPSYKEEIIRGLGIPVGPLGVVARYRA